jgi:hypothetical protein
MRGIPEDVGTYRFKADGEAYPISPPTEIRIEMSRGLLWVKSRHRGF